MLFLRSCSDLRKLDALVLLHLLGAKTVFLDYRETILQEILQQDLQSNIERMLSSTGVPEAFNAPLRQAQQLEPSLSVQGLLRMNA